MHHALNVICIFNTVSFLSKTGGMYFKNINDSKMC
jgi:hypothetical protein